jgi:hypothetical protein
MTTADATYLAGMGALAWADAALVRSSYAARQVLAAMLDAHDARCDDNYTAEPCAEYRELIDWLRRAEELYACALEDIEPDSEAHAARIAHEEAEFARGFDSACEDKATCKVHHLLADLIGGGH